MANELDTEVIDRLRIALTRISRRMDRQVPNAGLTSTQLNVLAAVALNGPIGLGELAEHQGVNPTMLSRIVNRLEQDGLVRRESSEIDRRAVQVAITPSGTRLRRRILAGRSELLGNRLTDLPAETVAAVIAALPALEALAAQLQPTVGVPS